MHLREFRNAGNGRVLFSAFMYFDMSFMVWVLLGALGTFIAEDLGLSASEKGLIIAVPLLAGSVFRLILGPLSDHIGGRRAGLIGLVLTTAPLLVGWLFADSLPVVLLVGIMLGVAGASFAVALPLASRWYPPEHQGLAMGIAGAGNSGTVLSALLAPRLAEQFGWQAVFGMALVPILITLVAFSILAKDSPHHPPPAGLKAYVGGLRRSETFWFCLFYSVTFGGFVGLSSYLGIFFRDQYGVSKVHAGDLTAACVIGGSLLRPVGGLLSDRVGGARGLSGVLAFIGIAMAALASLPPLVVIVPALAVVMATLGMGNGAVFQLIPQAFRRDIGVITGLVGAAGGVGGFFLPMALGSLKAETGSFAPGFLAFAAVAGLALLLLLATREHLARHVQSASSRSAAAPSAVGGAQ